MNNEQPIAFPRDLDEDWRLAQTTEAPVEYVPELRDEWRVTVQPQSELYLPEDVDAQELDNDLYEPAPDEMQQLLYAVSRLRPAKIEPGERLAEEGAEETHHQLEALNHESRLGLNEHAGQWARYATYLLEDVPFARAGKIHQSFALAVPDTEKWTSLALQAYGAYAIDDVRREKLERVVSLMANEERFQVLARKMIGLNLAQIQYWRDLQSTQKVKHVLRRLETDVDREIIEPSPTLHYVAGVLPLEEIVDPTTAELISSGLPEHEPTDRGEIMLRSIATWRSINAQPPTAEEFADTRSILVRTGLPGNQLTKLAYWARRLAFDAAGVDWQYAAAAHEQYGSEYQMSGTAWGEHTKQLRSQYLGKDSELEQLLDTCMQLVGVPESYRDLCHRVVALSQDEAAYWQKLHDFAHEVETTLSDETSIETLRQQLGTWAVREPGMIRRGDLRFTEDDLTYLPIDTLVQDEPDTTEQKDT